MKNVRSLVMNCVLAALVVLTIGFLAGNYGGIANGYDFLSLLEYVSFASADMGFYIVSILLVLILVLILFVFAVLGLLCDFQVIKSEKVAKIFRFVKLVLACLIFVITVAAFIIGCVEGGSTGWASIINLIVSVGLVATTVTDVVLARKK